MLSNNGRSGATTLPAGDDLVISSPPDAAKGERRVLKVPSMYASIGAALAAARDDDQVGKGCGVERGVAGVMR